MNKIKKRRVFYSIFIATFLFLITFSTVNANDGKKIRVGFFPLSGFQEYNEQGEPIGYNIEYLNKLAEYTGWEYEYIHADTWVKALKMLDNKEIDILAPSQKSLERQEKYLLSDYSIGMEYGTLFTWSKNNNLTYEEFEAFSDIKIGCVDSFIMKDDFLRYAEENNFKPKMQYYKDNNELMAALNNHQIDAAVASYASSYGDSKKLLARYSPSPYYYMMNLDSETLMEQLDNALDKLQTENPDFSNQLLKEWYPKFNIVPFTKKELEYINEAPTFQMGFMIREPLAYLDKNGKPVGIIIELMEKIAENSGFKFEYVPLSGESVTYDDLRKKKLQLITGVEYTKINKESSGMSLSMPFFASKKVLVGRKGIRFSPNANFKIAISTGSMTLQKTLKEKYPYFEVSNMPTTNDCLEAVLSSKADVMLQSQYAVEKLLAKPKYEKLIVIPDLGLEERLSISTVLNADGKGKINSLLADKRLMSVINKAIAQITDDEESNIVISYTAGIPYEITISDFIYQYRIAITIITCLMIIGIGLLTYSIKMRNANINIIKKNEKKLSCIANNINGGVIVLIPNKGFSIKYANSGFVKMIGASEEYVEMLTSGSYVTYIHEKDIKKLNELVSKDLQEGDSVELELRIRRLDGEYIPVIFRGTLAKDEDNIVLYCVVMDISEQKRILQEMEEEKERYAMVIEQTDDIIFDTNLEEKKVLFSNRYEQVFGWKVEDRHYFHRTNILHIHEDDLEILERAYQDLELGKRIKAIRVRLQKKDKQYLWCDVTMGVVRRKDKIVRLVGKITDVDKQVKEIERLESMSKQDGLTGMLKKEAFQLSVESILSSNIKKNNCVLLFIDLDNFKKLNDTLGHQCGDRALKDVAQAIKKYFTEDDVLGRFGGDEFFVFATNIRLQEFFMKVEQLRKELQKRYTGTKPEECVEISASMGFAYSDDGSEAYEELLSQADTAVYSAKEQGKNGYVMYHDGLVKK